MKKNELINRWYSDEGTALLNSIIWAFSKKKELEEIVKLNKYGGRWDLRGAPLSHIVDQKKIGDSKYQINLTTGSLSVTKYDFVDIDFTYADISYGTFQECSMDNCLLSRTKAREMHIYDCNFNNCVFEHVEFSYSFMNDNIGNHAGSYTNCKFIKSKLNECIFTFPVIDNCLFDDCHLYATNFDGSRMRNTKFKGEVNSCIFRSFSRHAVKSVFWLFNRVHPNDYPNRMDNIDFSEAQMYGVSFLNGINLDKCKFPDEEELLLIRDLKSIYALASKRIAEEWEGEHKRIGLNLINNVFFNKDKQNQPADLLDKKMMRDNNGIGERFFGLMTELANKSN
ncbi:uncharacterized protein YjbI with pentapeptide repeats [Pedobacter sp. AK013]|uniref:pentapeptide repeat-containing protein n=1 Tax=Pedobacter sp. AK013 TaxID=2723071 RepID=UPI0016119566|nr:pentapeptide repeat-containing protein [Pedobacter sp. AK013]MBB6238815.1 uncharacterized protein YjbI with pentapeptide repeats [Pedobacter sp. AK013]